MNSIFVDDKLSSLQKFFIFLIIITSGTPLTQDYSIPNILLILTFALLVVKKEISLNKLCGHLALILFALSILWSFQYLSCPNNLDYSVIYKYCLIIFSIIIFCTNTQSSSKKKIVFFIKVIVYSSFISNILFMLCVFGVDVPTIESKTHITPSFYYLGSAAFTEVYGLGGYRNYGIFWEPGLYQIYLNLSLIYFLYVKEPFFKRRWLTVIYLLFGIYTTGSTTGLFLAAFIVGYYAFFNSSMGLFVKVVFILAAISIASAVVIPYLMDNLTTKMDSASYLMRMNDLTFGYDVFMSKPVLGHGIANDIYKALYSSSFGEERGDSNGLINVLINFGIVGFIAYVRWFYRFAKASNSFFDGRVVIPVLIWSVASLCTEPISTHAAVFFVIGLGMGKKISPLNYTTTNTVTA